MTKYRTINMRPGGDDDWFAPGYGRIFDNDLIQKFFDRIAGEPDRSLVLISAALLDDLIEQKLKKHLSHGTASVLNRLFDALGPFSSTASKVDTLYCLGKINQGSHANLHAIRKLRNHCAHDWSEFRFDSETDARFLSNLSIPDFINEIPSDLEALPIHPKSKFNVATAMLILVLNIHGQHMA